MWVERCAHESIARGHCTVIATSVQIPMDWEREPKADLAFSSERRSYSHLSGNWQPPG